jgi:hypothetical protein
MKFTVSQQPVGSATPTQTNVIEADKITAENDFVVFTKDGKTIAMFPNHNVYSIVSA